MKRYVVGALAAILTCGVVGSAHAQLLLEHANRSNAVNHCQAFTPGPSNTIRNRVVGVENVGSAPVAVACAFQAHEALIYTQPKRLQLYTSNTSLQPISISCTMLVGYYGEPDLYLVTKTVALGAETFRGPAIEFNASDNPVPLEPTLGDSLVGVSCVLPPGGGLNEIKFAWSEIL